ncbi:hypothetical protein K438DRAFT_1938035 [Mycena galopus ATCC 62051]|nr:hypothetical protein K438DRAFT_1938035 [Mycena galopus ATCC 62051]
MYSFFWFLESSVFRVRLPTCDSENRSWPLTQFQEIQEYFWSSFRFALNDDQCTFFIRRSTGRFCADLIPNRPERMYPYSDSNTRETCQRGLELLAGPNIEKAVINSLALNQYYKICYWKLGQSRRISISTPTTTTLGAVYSGSLDTDRVYIAYIPDLVPASDTYFSYIDDRQRPKEVMENGWTRFTSGDVVDGESYFQWGHALRKPAESSRSWLSQANHIFNRLGISSNFDDYVLVERITFELSISLPTGEPPEAFLFLCPPENFLIGDTPSFKWPDCPAYWSFDPSGAERLSPEDAVKFGFPSMERSAWILGSSWGDMAYAGLRQFHQGKGFNPDSQDLARHLGYPLYQLSTEVHIPFAHIDGEHLCEGDEESNNIPEPVDAHHDASLNQDSQDSSLAEELSASNTFRFVRNLAAAFMPGAQDVESARMGFSPILM